MIESEAIQLRRAQLSDAGTLANLLELYVHDLSEVFEIEIGADGRFGYDRLERYFREPGKRFAFLITAGARLLGFVFAARGSPLSEDPEVLDVAEFFVLRRYRREGVGRRAASLLWNELPGSWVVRVAEGNRGALAFWPVAIAEHIGRAPASRTLQFPERSWRVFEFSSRR